MDRTMMYLAFGAVLIGCAAAATECYDCYWYSKSGDSDDKNDKNCNTKEGLLKVDKETCDGKCYTTTTHTAFGVFVGRGCDDDCQNGQTTADKWVVGLKGDRECCSGSHCNNEISAAPSVYASAITYSICLGAAFLFRALK